MKWNPAREELVAPATVPSDMAKHVAGRSWVRNRVGQAGASVYRLVLDGAADLYLKHGHNLVAADIDAEASRLRWLAAHIASPVVVDFAKTGDEAWLLSTAVRRHTAHEVMTSDPSQAVTIVEAIAAFLRRLHAIPVSLCPFDSGPILRLEQARLRMETGLVDVEDFDDVHHGWTARQVWDEMIALRPAHLDKVVTHGDFSLDNILVENGGVSGCIDVGRLGVADRYQDIAILWNGLEEFGPRLQTHFLDRYGIAALDDDKLRFHLALDEFF